MACVVLGCALRDGGWLMMWPAFALAMLALAYVGVSAEVFHKRDGRLPMATRVLLGPYLLGAWVTRQIYRRSGPRYVEVAPNVLFGRRLSRREARDAIADGVTAVLDLTAECSETPVLRALAYKNIPVLDLTPPTAGELREAVAFVRAHVGVGKVLVHCAIGCSRSACVAAAWLLAQGHESGVGEAVDAVRRVRPGVALGAGQLAALHAFRGGNGMGLIPLSDEREALRGIHAFAAPALRSLRRSSGQADPA